MTNYFQGVDGNPFHLSAGAVLVDGTGRIACQQSSRGVYSIMTETIEPEETIENAIARGLQEEYGAKAELVTFIGSLATTFTRSQEKIRKTTLYFLTTLVSIDPSLRNLQPDEEDLPVLWRTSAELLELGATRHPALPHSLFPQAEIIARAALFSK